MSGAADSSLAEMGDISRVGKILRRRRTDARVVILAYCSQLLRARATIERCIRAVILAPAPGEKRTSHSEIRSWRDVSLSPNRAERSKPRKSCSDFSLAPSSSLQEGITPSAAWTTRALFFKTKRSHASVGKGGVRSSDCTEVYRPESACLNPEGTRSPYMPPPRRICPRPLPGEPSKEEWPKP